jgi:hypothetical protein
MNLKKVLRNHGIFEQILKQFIMGGYAIVSGAQRSF